MFEGLYFLDLRDADGARACVRAAGRGLLLEGGGPWICKAVWCGAVVVDGIERGGRVARMPVVKSAVHAGWAARGGGFGVAQLGGRRGAGPRMDVSAQQRDQPARMTECK